MIGRRGVLAALAGGVAAFGRGKPARAEAAIDIEGVSPDLSFALQRAPDGREVTQADYRGDVALLYFGYTYCPDVCPLTMQNLARVFDMMGTAAKPMRALFVTVDPGRDDLASLARYAAVFGPEFVGLRGTDDQLAQLARRYRVAYSVSRAADGTEQVTHSSAAFVFGRGGEARLLLPGLASADADLQAAAAALRRVVGTEAGSF